MRDLNGFRLASVDFPEDVQRWSFGHSHLTSDEARVGHECENDKQATEDARLIAQRLSRERPEMFRDGNYICVTDDDDEEIVRVPLAFTAA